MLTNTRAENNYEISNVMSKRKKSKQNAHLIWKGWKKVDASGDQVIGEDSGEQKKR